MKLMLVIGARPQIIKSAPIIHECRKQKEIALQLVHTGQHYDFQLSKVFFQEMNLPDPVVNLGVGSGSHAWQTGNMMMKLEKVIIEYKPDLVLAPGDTNSTLATALAAVKLHVPIAHVEAGARSYDVRMPEEINRRLTDHCSSLLFAPTHNCLANLCSEGVPEQCIIQSGDTMYDALLQHFPIASKSGILEKLEIKSEDYAALTLHRPENVDAPESLEKIVKALAALERLTIVFPVHPRTKQRLATFRLLKAIENMGHVRLVDPLGYHDMLKLTKHAQIVFTDSGGLQKEAFWLHTPCITLRDTTEWGETVQLGANVLVGNNPKKIIETATKFLKTRGIKTRLQKASNPFGDGQAASKIVAATLKGGR